MSAQPESEVAPPVDPGRAAFRRVLLKLSGEALMGNQAYGVDPERGLQRQTYDEPGFWEVNGYHNDGDPWKEQRYWGD